MRQFTLAILFFIILSCGGPSNDGKYSRPFLGFNGRYCAEIKYYNPKTKITRKFYNYVEAEEDDLIVIYWPNEGGLIDLDHMDNQVCIDNKGYAAFSNEDGYEYKVQIVGEKCHY
jgi:hypothetical protein